MAGSQYAYICCCPVRAFAALRFRCQLFSYIAIMPKSVLQVAYLVYTHVRIRTCHPLSLLHIPPLRYHQLVSHASVYKGSGNLCTLCSPCNGCTPQNGSTLEADSAYRLFPQSPVSRVFRIGFVKSGTQPVRLIRSDSNWQ